MTSRVALASAPTGPDLHLVGVGGDPAVRRRLQSLGVRPGAVINLVRRTSGGGVVVAVDGARVALGHPLVAELVVEVRP